MNIFTREYWKANKPVVYQTAIEDWGMHSGKKYQELTEQRILFRDFCDNMIASSIDHRYDEESFGKQLRSLIRNKPEFPLQVNVGVTLRYKFRPYEAKPNAKLVKEIDGGFC